MLRRLCGLVVVACLAAPAFAQQAQDLAPPTLSETVSVGYVMIPFTVLGERNEPLTDVRGAEVNLLIDGIPVHSDMFEKSENAPVSFTILIDGSGIGTRLQRHGRSLAAGPAPRARGEGRHSN